ncbi:MAG: hypothetical protein JNM88_21160 [Chitinophagaceae bacterium]|nr:hypothetical protein [Chitinophagaceae bacterium]
MKARFRSLAVLALSLSIAFTACQKDKTVEDTDYTTQSSAHSDDQSRFSSESDAVSNDVNSVLDITAGFSGRTERITAICDATVAVDTLSNPRTITITYNGTNCLGNRTRTGVVVVSMAAGVRWKNPGAILTVSFQNLRITRLSDNKSITINGTQTYTNVSGGLLVNLPVVSTITHTITSSNMSITFDNGSQRTWSVARKRVFTYDGGIVATVTGTHVDGSATGIAEWGTNRFGNTFVTQISDPLVFRQSCSFRLTSGKVSHSTNLFNSYVIFGLDASGNPTTCPGSGTYYMKVVWTGPAGVTHTNIYPY